MVKVRLTVKRHEFELYECFIVSINIVINIYISDITETRPIALHNFSKLPASFYGADKRTTLLSL